MATYAVLVKPLNVSYFTDPNTGLTTFATGEDGSKAMFSVSLSAKPTFDVKVTFTSNDSTEGSIFNYEFLFNASNWNAVQTLSVKGEQDYLYAKSPTPDGDVVYSVTGKVETRDPDYYRVQVNPIAITNVGDKNEAGFDRDVPLQDYATMEYDTTGLRTYGYAGYGDVGRPSNDNLVGMDGNDQLYGLNLVDALSGGLGNDKLYGGYDDDFLYGDDDNDELYGQEDNDSMEGGTGNDTLDGGSGNDTMIGGAGSDTYVLYYLGTDKIEDKGLASDVDTVLVPYNMTSYTLPQNIENGTLTAGTDPSTLNGNSSDNSLNGNDGQNTLVAGSGDDTVSSGAGNDKVDAGTGSDTVTAGTGNDSVGGGLGNDTVTGDTGNDSVNGGYGNDSTDGGTGNDNVDGSVGNDSTSGGDGNDTVTGGEGNDKVSGGTGSDTVVGGTGGDFLTGGDGSDNYLFNVTPTTANVDIVTDFNVAADTVQLENNVFSSLVNVGTLNVNVFVIGSSAKDGNDRIIYDSQTGGVFYDDDGSGAHAQMPIATILGVPTLTSSDFFVV